MMKGIAILAACVLALASCGSTIGDAELQSYDASSYRSLQSINDGAYISFFDDGKHLASFAFKGSIDLGDYKGQKSVLTPTQKLSYEFIDLQGGVLLVRERGASRPTPVRAIDLSARKDLLKKGFFSVAKHSHENERDVILKMAGDRLNKDQLPLLKMTVEEMEKYATKAFKTGLAVEYYYKFLFDFQARQPTDLKEITPVLYPRENFLVF
jgi:hypothetical protein